MVFPTKKEILFIYRVLIITECIQKIIYSSYVDWTDF